LGGGKEFESLDELLLQEEAEKATQEALRKIETLAARYEDRIRDIWYQYEVGKILQFVDEKGLADRRYRIWRRMAFDLRPDLFSGKKKNEKESTRYPDTMYLLGKQKQKNVGRATWDQWYEILKFRKINEGKREDVLMRILDECKSKNLGGIILRTRIKELLASKRQAKC
jgi:hypothetical protein